MIRRSDFVLTHEPGAFPNTEVIQLRLTIAAANTIDLKQQERDSLDLRKITENKLLSLGMDFVYGGLEREIHGLRSSVMVNCGSSANRDAINAAFQKLLALLRG